MHFLNTSRILSVSLFDFAKLALAKRYAHCCFVNSDAFRLGGVEKNKNVYWHAHGSKKKK